MDILKANLTMKTWENLEIRHFDNPKTCREVEQNVTTWNTLLPLFPALTVPSTQHLVA